MNFPFRIARRYLFARKSTNAINIITGVSLLGIAIGTAALVLVLSVFNGFEDLITNMFNRFNPEVKITPAKGKTFEVDSLLLARVSGVPGVAQVTPTLEEIAFFEYKQKQDFGVIKGIEPGYEEISGIDSTLREGTFRLKDNRRNLAISGVGMRNRLGLNVSDPLNTLSVYMPRRETTSSFQQPFRRRFLYPGGTFIIQQEFDNQYVLASLDFVRELMGFDSEASALELRLDNSRRVEDVEAELEAILGAEFEVRNRFEQEESFLKLMQIEKWMSFAIVSLMMLLVAFNMVGALWMIVLEKKRDISILKSMGATRATVRRIFLLEGMLLSLVGIGAGFLLALLLYWAQQQFGLIGVPGQFMIQAYPVSLRGIDFFLVFLTVLAIGMLAAWPPAKRAERVPAILREL